MGIKHFFSWFKKKFIECIYRLPEFEIPRDTNIDILMIDMNGIFHNSTQKIYKYGKFKHPERLLGKNNHPPTSSSEEEKEIEVFRDVCENLKQIIQMVGPQKKIIMCIDGPAPLGKQNQQRQRRFKSAMESSPNPRGFDKNSITPGTRFMDSLSSYIDWYIRNSINTSPQLQNIEIVFSDEKAPGEGEHKLINYMRYYGNTEDTYCLYGLDADLIMLALGTHLPNFYILREDLYDPRYNFFLIDIGAVHTELAELLNPHSGDEWFPNLAINDFIFLCFMVGNDFLPHIPSIEIIENGIELILDIYKKVSGEMGHITSPDIKFRPQVLKKFLGILGSYEKENFEIKLARKKSFFPDKILNQSSYHRKGKWIVDIELYKHNYFTNCFPPNSNPQKIAHEYLEGMQWVLSYYSIGVPNWKWHYNHHYAPPASILAKHIDTFIFPQYPHTQPSTPFQQLLCVLPPQSAKLIPSPLSNLLTSETSPLKSYYPSEIKIDLGGKRQEWEGIVLLPQVDFENVVRNYKKEIFKICPQEAKRNVIGKTIVYQYCPNLSHNFKSRWGNIRDCKIYKYFIDL